MARVDNLQHSYATIQRVVETCVPSKTQAHRDLASVMQVLIKKGHYKAQRHQYALSVRGAYVLFFYFFLFTVYIHSPLFNIQLYV
jgi:ribosomal protein S13